METRILLVDDEPSLLQMMTVYLQRRGYRVTVARTAEQAAALADAEPLAFAVAVLDGSIGGIGMQELALRLLRLNPALRVLAASGYPVDMSALEAAAPGQVAFLHKPFTPEMLAAAVRRMIAPQEEAGL